ncbi:hypothetical protein MA16_Dca024178 [Dendrobium catenatum]|uniref:Uncharacterized protein n=1 Tax=Dendrobium catenatum TaxID=906689 RepID=A0A2I0WCI0_9ASPA|nr:hypothetical protein MA16_Dca024178 [Dendrobium catenatum]
MFSAYTWRVLKDDDSLPHQGLVEESFVKASSPCYGAMASSSKRSRITKGPSSRAGDDNFLSRANEDSFLSTRAQGNEDAEQYMLSAMIEMAENVDFILAGMKNCHPFKRAGGGLKNVNDPQKCRPKGISNARLKSHWEMRMKRKKKSTIKQGPESTTYCSVTEEPLTQPTFS